MNVGDPVYWLEYWGVQEGTVVAEAADGPQKVYAVRVSARAGSPEWFTVIDARQAIPCRKAALAAFVVQAEADAAKARQRLEAAREALRNAANDRFPGTVPPNLEAS